jgi:hypothetical protein
MKSSELAASYFIEIRSLLNAPGLSRYAESLSRACVAFMPQCSPTRALSLPFVQSGQLKTKRPSRKTETLSSKDCQERKTARAVA